MKHRQVFFIFVALNALLAVLFVGSGFAANTALSQKSLSLDKIKAESQVLDELQASITKNKADIKRYSDLNSIAKAIVPQDKDQSQTIREIVKIAQDSGIAKLSSVNFPASDLGGAGISKSSPVSQALPVKGISGVYLLPITVAVESTNSVTFPQFITFLEKLENNRRTSQISDISIRPDTKNPNLIAFTLTINEYIKP
ncbi:MAG: hypothetical protein WBO35_01235 [Candidatus Saccharimonadales bacterium]|jgi:cell division protein FtsB